MDFNKDKFLSGEVEHPRFIVKSDKIAIPFYEKEYAKMWQQQVFDDIGLETQIIDLTNYDWVNNPNGLRIHKLKS